MRSNRLRPRAKCYIFTALDLLQVPKLALFLARHSATIVLYHGVLPRHEGDGIFNYRKKFITPEAFGRQLAWLKRRYTILPLAELVERLAGSGSLPRRTLAITFDDGYENIYAYAFPILKRLGIPATVFVATDLVEPGRPLWVDRLEYAIGASKTAAVSVPCGGRTQQFTISTYAERCRADAIIRALIKQLPAGTGQEILTSVVAQTGADLNAAFAASPYRGLSWDQMREMQASGITFASHTRSHPILSRLPPAEAEKEIAASSSLLRERLDGGVLNIFAYPNGQPGDFNADTITALRRSGFRAALTTIPGFAAPDSDPFALPRLTLDGSDDVRFFRLTVTGVRYALGALRATSSPVSARAFFNAAAESYARAYGEETPEGHSFRERKYLALKMLGDVRGRRVLDIGSGPGVITGELLRGEADVIAIDIAPAMVAALKEKFPNPRLEARVGDIEALDLPDGSCNTTVALGVFEYLKNDERALAELRRVLKSDGNAIISFPNYWSPWRLWNRLLLATFKIPWRIFQSLTGRRPHPVRHREYSIRGIRLLAGQAGFEITAFAGYNFKLVPFPFDRLFPKFTVAFARRLSGLARSKLKFLGTGYLISFRKK